VAVDERHAPLSPREHTDHPGAGLRQQRRENVVGPIVGHQDPRAPILARGANTVPARRFQLQLVGAHGLASGDEAGNVDL
jgi:hypothetical protein